MRNTELSEANWKAVVNTIAEKYETSFGPWVPSVDRSEELKAKYAKTATLTETIWKSNKRIAYNIIRKDKDFLKIFRELRSKKFDYNIITINIKVPLDTALEHSGSDYCLRYYIRREINKQNRVLICLIKQEQLRKTDKYRFYKIEVKTKEREVPARLPTVEEKKLRAKEIELEKAKYHSEDTTEQFPPAWD